MREGTSHPQRHRDLDRSGADGRLARHQRRRRYHHDRRRRPERVRRRSSRRSLPTSSATRSFPEAELARLKTNLSRNLAVALSQPQQLALQKFRSVLYGDHAFGRVFPTDAMIAGYTVDAGQGGSCLHLRRRRAPRSTSSVSSTPPAMEAAIRKAFAAGRRARRPRPSRPKPSIERAVHLVDRPGAPQSTIVLGMPTIEPSSDDFVALTVMDALLGGAFGSRITRNIREDKGYTYSPYSEISTRYRDAYWAENADVTTAQTGLSLKEIFSEIDRLQAAAARREGAHRDQELPRRHLRVAELEPRRHYRAAAVRRSARAAGRLSRTPT